MSRLPIKPLVLVASVALLSNFNEVYAHITTRESASLEISKNAAENQKAAQEEERRRAEAMLDESVEQELEEQKKSKRVRNATIFAVATTLAVVAVVAGIVMTSKRVNKPSAPEEVRVPRSNLEQLKQVKADTITKSFKEVEAEVEKITGTNTEAYIASNPQKSFKDFLQTTQCRAALKVLSNGVDSAISDELAATIEAAFKSSAAEVYKKHATKGVDAKATALAESLKIGSTEPAAIAIDSAKGSTFFSKVYLLINPNSPERPQVEQPKAEPKGEPNGEPKGEPTAGPKADTKK